MAFDLGSLTGAATGMGTGGLVGGAIGLGAGIYSDVEKSEREKEAREATQPKRKRMTRILGMLNQYKQQQLAAKTSSAAAGFDWASQLRF